MTGTAINRIELVHALETVAPGASARDAMAQSASFIFRRGFVYTFNGELLCRSRTPLPADITAAVHARSMLSALKEMSGDDVGVEFKGTCLRIVGDKREGIELTAETEILLPIAEVEKPEVWKPLDEAFCAAVQMAVPCVAKGQNVDAKWTHVHITPDFIEACDNVQIVRHKCHVPIEDHVLARRDPIAHIASQAVNEIAETPGWLHFRAGKRASFSVQRYADAYPDLSGQMEFTGVKTPLPKAIIVAAKLAGVLSGENPEDDEIAVSLKPGRVRVRGTGTHGRAFKDMASKYAGPPIGFRIPPKMLIAIVEQHNACEIGDKETKGIKIRKLRCNGGPWCYVTNLSMPESNGNGKHE